MVKQVVKNKACYTTKAQSTLHHTDNSITNGNTAQSTFNHGGVQDKRALNTK